MGVGLRVEDPFPVMAVKAVSRLRGGKAAVSLGMTQSACCVGR